MSVTTNEYSLQNDDDDKSINQLSMFYFYFIFKDGKASETAAFQIKSPFKRV